MLMNWLAKAGATLHAGGRRAAALAAGWSLAGSAVWAMAQQEAVRPRPSLPPEQARSLSWAFAAILGIILAFVALVTALLVMRSLRRARQRLLQPRPEPTEYVDVWQMHKLPADAEGGQPDEGPPDERTGE